MESIILSFCSSVQSNCYFSSAASFAADVYKEMSATRSMLGLIHFLLFGHIAF